MMNVAASILFSLCMLTGFSGSERQPAGLVSETDTTDWQAVANRNTDAFIEHYWDTDDHIFTYLADTKDEAGKRWDYWPQAHAMDVVIDAYIRTGCQKYADLFPLWYEGVRLHKCDPGSYRNDFYDDMEWICLTMLRLYGCTSDVRYLNTAKELWHTIKEAWNDLGGGGLAWKTDMPYSKNACSNGPGGLVAARLYAIEGNPEDLEWAVRIHGWQKSHLVEPATGKVYDCLNANTGETNTWSSTYNQGTYLGMSYELYRLTGEREYLHDACCAAEYAIAKLTRGGILYPEGNEDLALFKGIFIRYFVGMLGEKQLTAEQKTAFTDFFNENASVLHEKGVAPDGFMYSNDWSSPGYARAEGGNRNYLHPQVSALTMIEAKARYEKEPNK